MNTGIGDVLVSKSSELFTQVGGVLVFDLCPCQLEPLQQCGCELD